MSADHVSDPFLDEEVNDALERDDPRLIWAMTATLATMDEEDYQVHRAAIKARFGDRLSVTALDKATAAKRNAAQPQREAMAEETPANDVALAILAKNNVLNVDDTLYWYDGTKWAMTRASYLNHLALQADGEEASSKHRRTEIASFIAAKIYKRNHRWRNIEMYEVPLANGVIDVRTMQVRPHRVEDYIQTCVPWLYNPNAQCPVLMRCLDTYFGGDDQGEAKIAALQEFFGYCLMPHARYKRALFCLGESDCGKSTIPFLLRILLGAENCTAVSVTAMDDERKRAPLLGKLVNLLTELTSDAMIADGGFKTLVSTEEPILFDVKWGGVFMDIPICKHVIVSNSKPGINDRSNGTYRRLLLVHFRHVIPAGQQDTTIWDQLRGEVDGILSWALEGAQRLYAAAGRFTDPGAEEVEEYRQSENVMLSFVEHYCEVDLTDKTRTSQFIERFNSLQARKWRPNAVLQAVRDLGYEVEKHPTHSIDGKKYRHVIGLKVC